MEHAPLAFHADAGWSHVRHTAPPQPPTGPIPDSPTLGQLPLGPPQQPPAGPPPPQAFATLEELLRFFSRKASHGLVFRRVPGSAEYEVVEEGMGKGQGKAAKVAGGAFPQQQSSPYPHQQQAAAGGGSGGVLGWLHRRVQSTTTPAAQQQKHQQQQQQPPLPEYAPPAPEEVVALYRELRGALLSAGLYDEAREEGLGQQHQHGGGHGFSGSRGNENGGGKVAALLRAREVRKRRERALLEHCHRSCEAALAALARLGEEGKGGGAGGRGRVGGFPLPCLLLDGAHDHPSVVGVGEGGPGAADPGDAEALLERLGAVEARVAEVVSALNASLLVREVREQQQQQQQSLEGRADPEEPLVQALRAVAGWRPYLETLRLRVEADAAAPL